MSYLAEFFLLVDPELLELIVEGILVSVLGVGGVNVMIYRKAFNMLIKHMLKDDECENKTKKEVLHEFFDECKSRQIKKIIQRHYPFLD